MQEAWKNLQQQSISKAADTGGDSTLLLRVIANSAARFPVAQAAHLATDLLKVRVAIAQWYLYFCMSSVRLQGMLNMLCA